nr:uncharacterized protein LOC113822627 [Penaeus vannamei]
MRKCVLEFGGLLEGFTLWYKEERLVEYESSGGRIRVLTLPEGMSHLEIEDARTADSGNYTCSPSGGVPASLVLNVIEGEEWGIRRPTLSAVFDMRETVRVIQDISSSGYSKMFLLQRKQVTGAGNQRDKVFPEDAGNQFRLTVV